MQPIRTEEALLAELLKAGMYPPDEKNPRCVICGERPKFDLHRSDDHTAVYVCGGACWSKFVATDIYKAANPEEPTPDRIARLRQFIAWAKASNGSYADISAADAALVALEGRQMMKEI